MVKKARGAAAPSGMRTARSTLYVRRLRIALTQLSRASMSVLSADGSGISARADGA